MTYSDLDLSTLERDAYWRGDMNLSSLLAALEDQEAELVSELETAETERDQAVGRAEAAESELAALQERVRELLEHVDNVLTECKRISKREELEAALQAIYNAVS